MVYCSKCGKELSEDVRYCPECGSAVNAPDYYRPEPRYAPYRQEETGAVAWGILSFILTIVTGIGGLILCLVLYGCGKPKGGLAALIGMILAVAAGVVLVVFYIVLLASSSTTTILCQMIC